MYSKNRIVFYLFGVDSNIKSISIIRSPNANTQPWWLLYILCLHQLYLWKWRLYFFPFFFPFRSRKMFIINVCVVCLWLLFIHTYTILLDLATNNKNVSIISVASKWRHIIACVDRCRQSRRNVYDFPPKNLQLHHCSNEYKTNKWFANVVWVSQATIFQITLDESRFLRFRRYPDTNFFAPENKKLLTTTYNRKSLKLKS